MRKLIFIVMIIAGAAATPLFAQDVVDVTGETGVKEITVTNERLVFFPSEIRVNLGDTVRLTYENGGGRHDWVLDEFDAATDVIRSGESQTIEFVASEAGSSNSTAVYRATARRGCSDPSSSSSNAGTLAALRASVRGAPTFV
jgi:plastocyanin